MLKPDETINYFIIVIVIVYKLCVIASLHGVTSSSKLCVIASLHGVTSGSLVRLLVSMELLLEALSDC